MKLKDVFLGLCVAALLISDLFLFSANRQKEAEQSALSDTKQQVVQLQNELQQVKDSTVDSRNMQFARLRSDSQELPRLRAEVAQLQATNQDLALQLETLRTNALQQQEQLQQLAAQAEQQEQQTEAAAPQAATPADAQRNECINNLREIDAAKSEWALENKKGAYAIPTEQDLLPYLPSGFPVCPSGGTYTINAVGVPPTCSVPGHVLPQ
jgi:hypothetical protein